VAFIDLAKFAYSLIDREQQVAYLTTRKTKKKVFYRWFDGYFHSLEAKYYKYT